MGTRIEIFRTGLWRVLRLRDEGDVKYNRVINRIGNLETREISHTNTFSLPQVFQNTDGLGLNVFNRTKLAIALNSKYPARYYVEDKLLQQGFLVINNTIDGTIQVNFIDEGLDIIERWGSTTFNQLILAIGDSKPADYIAAINELTGYDMDKTAILVPLTNVGGRGYNLALFPNNLNSIGDEFQINEAGGRVEDTFNPYQSRPIFNAKAIMDLACESYGFATTFDSSIDLTELEKLFIVAGKLGENQRDDGGILTKIITDFFSIWHFSVVTGGGPVYRLECVFEYGNFVEGIKPEDVANYVDPVGFNFGDFAGGYHVRHCIYVPDIIESFSGTIRFEANVVQDPVITDGTQDFDIVTIWENVTPGGDTVGVNIPPTTDASVFPNFDITFTKTDFNVTPAGTNGVMIGILIQVRILGAPAPRILQFEDMKVTETFLPSGVISYDEFGQYIANTISLTHAAPKATLKTLMSAIMHQQGILINVDGINKTIKFFTYGAYQTQRENGNFSDWSSFFIKESVPLYNTDYGTQYAVKNTVGLSSPYINNTFDIVLNNQGFISKLKDSIEKFIKKLKDVSSIFKINNTITPYFEYKNLGLGMVEEGTSLGNLQQARADGTTQGAPFSGLSALQNVNYARIPEGVVEWYRLVDKAVKVEASFFLPVNDVKTLDLSEPIFVNDLGGFFIIEEIAEYTNAQTPVRVKLIQLIDNLITV